MKIGVISDIHSNIVAFRACVDYLEEEGCDEYFLLGDYVSDTPYTRETLDFLYTFIQTHTCYLLRGNREEYMLAQREDRLASRKEKKWMSTHVGTPDKSDPLNRHRTPPSGHWAYSGTDPLAKSSTGPGQLPANHAIHFFQINLLHRR